LPEGLAPAEVGKEIAEHRKHGAGAHEHRDRWISIVEAVILSSVAVLAAYSGYAAAKWATESSVSLARASTLRTKASRADLEALVTVTQDSVSFNAWFTAFVAGHVKGEQLAIKRLRPGYKPAFFAWLATDPAHNPNAPPDPAAMPQYVIPQQRAANAYDTASDAAFTKGENAGGTSDEYVRDTVFLAAVLFLIGISGHFRLHQARYALVAIGLALLTFSIVQLGGLPAPP
jgi:hypothetical protein